MKRLTKLSLFVAAAATATFGGTVYAFADWTITTPPTVLKMPVAAMPAGNAPSVGNNGKNSAIDWSGSKVTAGVNAESYIVTRFGAGKPLVVCDRVTNTSCKDKAVPEGTWTWKVQPVFKTWIGEYSPPSVALTFGGPQSTTADRPSATSPVMPTATPRAKTPSPAVALKPSPAGPSGDAEPLVGFDDSGSGAPSGSVPVELAPSSVGPSGDAGS